MRRPVRGPLAALAVTLVAAASLARGQAAPNPFSPGGGGGGNPFGPGGGGEMPAAQAKAAPPWARSGTRMVYFEGAATIANAATRLVPNANGTWTNANGQRFQSEDVGASGGGGLTVLDVGHDDAGSTSLVFTTYVLGDPATGTMTLSGAPQQGGVGPRFTNSTYYFDPADLARMPDGTVNGVTTIRMPYPMDGHTYRALRVITETDTGGSMNTWDLDTGLLLYASVASVSYGAIPGQTTSTVGAASTSLSITKLLQVRNCDLPWADAPAPAWTQQVRRLEYAGNVTTMIANGGGVAPPQPFGFACSLGDHGEHFLAYQLQIANTPGTVSGCCGSASRLGIYLPPRAMGRLQQGQVLDDDKFVGAKLVVAQADGQRVTLSEVGKMFRRDVTYDANGMMVAARTTLGGVAATTVIDVQLRSAN